MKRYIISLAALSVAVAGCQRENIDDTITTDSSFVERQIIISGSADDITRGNISDVDNKFDYVWDADHQFILGFDGAYFENEGATSYFSPTTITPMADGQGAQFAADYSLTADATTIAAGTQIVSMGPLENIAGVDNTYTASMPVKFEAGSQIPREFLFVQGQTTTTEEMDYTELSTLNISHNFVPALVKFTLSAPAGSSVKSVMLKASSAIFPTKVTLDGANVENVENAYTNIITVSSDDAAATALYALVLPTTLGDATIDVIATIGSNYYEIGTLDASKIGEGFNGGEAYVIPVSVDTLKPTDNLLINGSFENGTTDGWAKYSGTTSIFGTTTVDPVNGTSSLYVYSTANNNNYTRVSQQVTGLKPNTTYYFGAKYHTSDATTLEEAVSTEESTATPNAFAQVQVRSEEGNGATAYAMTTYLGSTANYQNSKESTLYGSFNTGENTTAWIVTITRGHYGIYDDFYLGENPNYYGFTEHDLTLNMNDDDNNVEESMILDGSNLSITTPVREGYSFINWYTDAALTTPYIKAPISGDLTLYAKWLSNDLIPVVGSYYYEDGTYSETLDSSKKAVGIIVGLDNANTAAIVVDINAPYSQIVNKKKTGFAWAESADYSHFDGTTGLGTNDAIGGVGNMKIVLGANTTLDPDSTIPFEHYPAFNIVHKLNETDEDYSNPYDVWYLPIEGDITYLYNWMKAKTVATVNKMKTDAGATNTFAALTASGTRYWSSSDNNNSGMIGGTLGYKCRYIGFKNTGMEKNFQAKTGTNFVIPMLKFQYVK